MRYFHKYIPIILFLILASCKKEKNQIFVKEFPFSQKLKGVPITSIKPYYPYKIMVEDSLLVILNRKGQNFFQVYSTNTMNLLVEFGSKGRGPGEFNEPTFTNQKVNINGKLYHVIFDRIGKQISYIDFKDYVKDKSTTNNYESLPDNFGGVARFAYHSDSLSIMIPSNGGGGRFIMFRDKKKEIIGYLPELPFPIHKDNYYPLYANKSSIVNTKKRKFVGSLPMLGQYDFFDFSGKLLYSTVIHRDENLKNKVSSTPISFKKPVTLYQTELKAEGDLIYSVYYKYTAIEGSSSAIARIHVLDWDGKPIKEYILDRPILSFAYDKINNCFYGVAPYEEDYQIIKYDLNNMKK